MREIAVVASASIAEPQAARDEVELIAAVVTQALAESGVTRDKVGFVCSGSADLLIGRPFSFVQGLDGIAAWPPIRESHVEMDGAWALYEAWCRLQLGDIDAALVYAFGRPSAGNFSDVSVLQMDPYTATALWPDSDSLASLQANLMLSDEALARQRQHDPQNVGNTASTPHPIFDGAAAVVLAAGDLAREVCPRPAWIAGLDHRVEAHALGARDLSRSVSTRQAASNALHETQPFATAHIWASHSHCVQLISDAFNAAGCNTQARFEAGPFIPMVTGLANIGRAADDVQSGTCSASVAHASSGALQQHNLVCLLESRS
jgi:hypothetical protein